jgi:hypothetical protein
MGKKLTKISAYKIITPFSAYFYHFPSISPVFLPPDHQNCAIGTPIVTAACHK